jgi:hypothetical protein
MRTKKTYRDFMLTIEWRWPEETGDSGVLLRIFGEDRIWPVSLEVQLEHARAGDLVGLGTSFGDRREGAESRVVGRRGEDSERPAGEWNRCVITCRRGDVEVRVNGRPQNKVSANIPFEGHIGLQSDGAAIDFRRVVLEPLD